MPLLTRGRARRTTSRVPHRHKGLPLRIALVALVFCVMLVPGVPQLASEARADVGQRFPRLTKLSEDVVRGGMPLGYVPLRQLWAECVSAPAR